MVVAAAVVPAAFGAFVLLGIAEACRLLVQHRVERVLDSAPDERFQVVPESGFVDFDYISFHRMVLFSLICGYFKSKNWNILFFYPLSGICERKYTLLGSILKCGGICRTFVGLKMLSRVRTA